MSFQKGLVSLFAVSALLFLVACGSNNGTVKGVAPPSGGFSDSNLNGTYVFSVSGTDDVNGGAFAAVGTLIADGSGNIKGGTIDMNDNTFTASLPNASINSNSTYHVGPDGRGTATLGIPSSPFGSNMTIAFVLQDNSHGLVTEFDNNATGSGTLDLQTASVPPAGTYAFLFSGATGTGSSFASVGNFAVGSGGAISGLEDFNQGALIVPAVQTLTGSVVLGPSSTPATILNTAQFPGGLVFDVYAIDASHLKFIEMDTVGTLSGDAFSQTSTAITGTLAFTLSGFLTSSGDLAAGGFMVTDGVSGITNASTEDFNLNGSVSTTPGPFTATYTPAGAGRYAISSFTTFVGGTTYAAYPSSGGLLMLEIDTSGLTFGAAFPQTAGATFAASQGYGLNLTGINSVALGTPVEVDDIAEFTAGSSGTLTGAIDENFAPQGTPNSSLALSGPYTAPDANGRGQAVGNAGNNSNSTLNGGFAITFYTVDGTTFPFIEVDSGQVAAGVFVQQSSSATPAVAGSRMFVMPPLAKPRAALRKKN